MAYTVANVLLDGSDGMTDASTTRRPSIPCTRSSPSTTDSAVSPIAHVPTGVVVRRRGRAYEAAKRLLVVHRRTRRQFLSAPCLERGRAPDRTGDPESSDHRCHVAIVAEIVRLD